jgi:ATP-dependent RNA helicase DBP3
MRHVLALAASTKKDKLSVRVVVISPTRELAMQIFEVLEKYSKDAGLRAVCLYGGVPKDDQRQKLRTAQVIVATPGRLNDLINEGSADLSKVSYLVLDEADRMLDKGVPFLPFPTSQYTC